MALANSLSSGGTQPRSEAAAETEPSSEQQREPSGQEADPSALSALLGGSGFPLGSLDPKLLQAGLDLAREYSRNDPEQAALLSSLKPFLQEERQAKLDRAVQLARMARTMQAAYRMFRERNGGGASV